MRPVPWHDGHVTLSLPVNSTYGNWAMSSLLSSPSRDSLAESPSSVRRSEVMVSGRSGKLLPLRDHRVPMTVAPGYRPFSASGWSRNIPSSSGGTGSGWDLEIKRVSLNHNNSLTMRRLCIPCGVTQLANFCFVLRKLLLTPEVGNLNKQSSLNLSHLTNKKPSKTHTFSSISLLISSIFPKRVRGCYSSLWRKHNTLVHAHSRLCYIHVLEEFSRLFVYVNRFLTNAIKIMNKQMNYVYL